MEEKNELNDILLGNDNSGGTGKKIALVIAGALLIFFIALGVMKLVNSSDESQTNIPVAKTDADKAKAGGGGEANGSAGKEQLSPEAANEAKLNEIVKKLQSEAKDDVKQPQSVQPKQAAATPAAPSSAKPAKATEVAANTEVPIKPMIPEAKEKEQPKAAAKPEESAAVLAKKEAAKPAEQSKAAKPKEAPKPEHQAAQKPKTKLAELNDHLKAKEATKEPAAEEPKKEEQKAAEPKTAEQPAAEKVTSGSSAYYIQVGSLESMKFATELTSKIEKNGYKYKTTETEKDGKKFNKILVGPFNSKDDAKKELLKVKENIANGAFIVKG